MLKENQDTHSSTQLPMPLSQIIQSPRIRKALKMRAYLVSYHPTLFLCIICFTTTNLHQAVQLKIKVKTMASFLPFLKPHRAQVNQEFKQTERV